MGCACDVYGVGWVCIGCVWGVYGVRPFVEWVWCACVCVYLGGGSVWCLGFLGV